MRVMKFACAMALSAGIALYAGSASAGVPGSDIFEGDWRTQDAKEPNTSSCILEMLDTGAAAQVEGNGVGTGGVPVEIRVFSGEPTNTSRDTKQGRVSQNRYSFFNIRIDGDSILEGGVFPEKCKIDVSVNGEKGTGSGSVNCKGGDLNATLSANEIAAIESAFIDSKQVKFKTNTNKQTWELTMKCKGDAVNED